MAERQAAEAEQLRQQLAGLMGDFGRLKERFDAREPREEDVA